MFTKFIEVDLDVRNVEFPTEKRFIALIHGQYYSGEFVYIAFNDSMKNFFQCDTNSLYDIGEIERLWEISDNQTPLSVQDAINRRNPLTHGTLPLTSYPGWYFVKDDYNQPKEFLRLYLVLPDILLRGLSSSNMIFGEEFSDAWGFKFTEDSPIRAFFIVIPKNTNRETALTECLKLVNDICREINSYMADSMCQTPLTFGDISLGFVTSTCHFNSVSWDGILTVCLPTGANGNFLRQNLRSRELLFGQHLTDNWGELSNRYRYVKIPVFARTKQGIEAEKDKCLTTIIDTFQRVTKFQDSFNLTLFRCDMIKYYHGLVPPTNIQIGEYHMTTTYQHDKWMTELSLHIPTSKEGTITIPYMTRTILKNVSIDTKPSLLGEKLWPLWGSYTPNFRFRTVLFSGETSDESRLVALQFIQAEKEQFLALVPWHFDSNN